MKRARLAMAKRHVPNTIPVNARIALALGAVVLLVYMSAGLATGHTYIPGKRGGFLLSGLPTLFIVFSASALFLASLLTIVDHYDKRPNEATYAATRGSCLKAALYSFIAAPFIELVDRLFLLRDVHVFPEVHGLAENYTFYTPKLQALTRYVDPILDNVLAIGLLSLATGALAKLIHKYSSNLNRVVGLLIGLSMLGLSVLMLASDARDFFMGEVKAGRRYVVQAEQEPAKFNAVLLAHFMLGGILFTASAFMLVGVATGRDGLLRRQDTATTRTEG
jgi:hypothetical protein